MLLALRAERTASFRATPTVSLFFLSIRAPMTAEDAPSSGLSVGMFSTPELLYFCSSAGVERKSSKKTGK